MSLLQEYDSNYHAYIPKMVNDFVTSHTLWPRSTARSSKIRNLWKGNNSSSYEKFMKILKPLFVEPLKTAIFRATKKTNLCFHLLWFFCHCSVDENNIHLVDFLDTHFNDTVCGFPTINASPEKFQKFPKLWKLQLLHTSPAISDQHAYEIRCYLTNKEA